MSSNLKPCPFCGSNPDRFYSVCPDNPEEIGLVISCRRIGCVTHSMGVVLPERLAENHWNKRSGEEALRAEIERLQDELVDVIHDRDLYHRAWLGSL